MAAKNTKKLKLKKPLPVASKGKPRASGVVGTATVAPAPQNDAPAIDPNSIDELISGSAEVSEGQREFMSPATSVRKKRGRPSNAEKEAQAEQEKTDEPKPPEFDNKPIFKAGFEMLSQTLKSSVHDERFGLLQSEIDNFTILGDALVNKWSPDVFNKYALELAAAAAVIATGFRLRAVGKMIISERKAEEARRYPPPIRPAPQPEASVN